MSRKRPEPQHVVHKHEKYSPFWTLFSVGCVAVSVYMIGRWLRDVGQAENFASVLVLTLGFTAKYWIRRRPDSLRRGLGVYGPIGIAMKESAENLEKRVYRQSLWVVVPVAACYGAAFIAAKEVVLLALTSLYSWALVVGLATAVGAVVARPQLYSSLKDWLSPDEDESEDDGPRAERAKAGENPDESDRDGDPPGNLGIGEES